MVEHGHVGELHDDLAQRRPVAFKYLYGSTAHQIAPAVGRNQGGHNRPVVLVEHEVMGGPF